MSVFACAFETLLEELSLLAGMPADPDALRALVAHYRALQQRVHGYAFKSAPSARLDNFSAGEVVACSAQEDLAASVVPAQDAAQAAQAPKAAQAAQAPKAAQAAQAPKAAQAAQAAQAPKAPKAVASQTQMSSTPRLASCLEPMPSYVPTVQLLRRRPAQTAPSAGSVNEQDMLASARRESQISAHELEKIAQLMRRLDNQGLDADADAATLIAHIECVGLVDE